MFSDGMKAVALVIGLFAVAFVVVGLLALGWLKFFEGPAITIHAQNVRHGLNFVQGANQRAESAMASYAGDTADGDAAHASTDRAMACSAASSIDPGEQQPDVQRFVAEHCGPGGQ